MCALAPIANNVVARDAVGYAGSSQTKADGEVHFFTFLVLFFSATYFVADQNIQWYYSETDLQKKIKRNT